MSRPDIPKWRQDFDFSTESDEYVSRRDFLRFLTLTCGALALGNVLTLGRSLWKGKSLLAAAKTLDICAADALEPGSWLVFHYPDPQTPAILVRRESGEFVAFSQKCPHLACPVIYQRSSRSGAEPQEESIKCHCHNGRFSLETGRGISGPPRELRPLERIEIEINRGRILAKGFHSGVRRGHA